MSPFRSGETTATRGWGLASRGEQTGLLVAAAIAPGTFVPSLVPRSTMDQGIVTGLATTLSYVLTVGCQDLIEGLGASIARTFADGGTTEIDQRRATVAMDLAIIPAGLIAQRLLPRRHDEAIARGLLRQAAWRTTATGVGSATFALAQTVALRLDTRLGANGRIARFPIAVPLGLGLAYAIEGLRRRDLPDDVPDEDVHLASPGRAAAAGLAVAGGLTLLAYGEHFLARGAGKVLGQVLPGPDEIWRQAGHAVCLGGLVVAGTALFHRAIHKIEAATMVMEPILEAASGHDWIGTNASGGPGSLVDWASLGREGRRHAFSRVHAEPIVDRPAGIPDLSIRTVMGEPAKARPVQVYVGLDSAPTAGERVDLALAEMDRTGAWDRSMLLLISPTGTGYVNYCATAAVEYLTRGDVATVTMQYSKRPSPLSLMKIKDAREQNRLLWLAISSRLRDRKGSRPRVVLFGESLGAHTSQDVLLHWGTLGPQALGIERALWIGTPYGSGWFRQVTGPSRPDVDPAVVATFNDFGQLEAMPAQDRAKLRYVMVSHDNDGVTKFGVDLISSRPRWLDPDRTTVEAVPGASPRGVPARIRWRPLTTFLQSMVDMKNAQIPGAYRAWAHDYRPDLARFIREVYDLDASAEQMARIEEALRTREEIRERLLTSENLAAMVEPANPTPSPPSP